MNKKRLIVFNSFDYGSTGILCNYLSQADFPAYNKSLFICSNSPKTHQADYYLYENTTKVYRKIQSIIARRFNKYGFVGKKATKTALKFVNRAISPEDDLIISLHQIESSLFCLDEIIRFARNKKAKIFITLHDCWLFTGKCPYFDITGCNTWVNECDVCNYKKDFPFTSNSNIKKSFLNKINLVLNNKDIITLVCPSNWIAKKLEISKLKDMNIAVIHNGIQIDDCKIKKNENKKIGLISAAYPWTERKGLKFLKFLSNELDYSKYELTIVGLIGETGFSNNTKLLPKINRNELFDEFAKNDYFVNPTMEDNFPTTNIEALSCGLKIVSFDTGGSCESFDNETGFICDEKTNKSLLETILKLGKNNNRSACIKRAKMYFSKDIFIKNYYNLFNNEN